jgi:hypothetical protein
MDCDARDIIAYKPALPSVQTAADFEIERTHSITNCGGAAQNKHEIKRTLAALRHAGATEQE